MLIIKAALLTAAGTAGGVLAKLLGGFDHMLMALIVFMAVDTISGWLAAIFFKASKKTKSGRLSSSAGFRGLVKKGCVLMLVVVAVHLDGLLGTNSLTRDAVIIAFSANELLSILENMGTMGIKLPDVLVNALDILGKPKDVDEE